ncbi:MAG: hypothetical protein QME60_01400 [Verrucomicrobiota bacterium]|nr:hypothetical protein [Verrucomicrobiota bacterium]
MWWRAKLREWKREGRLAEDGRLKIRPMRPLPPGLTIEALACMLFAKPVRTPSAQVREMRRRRSRRKMRGVFDRRGCTE